MAKDYVPRPDGEFMTWSKNWQAYAADHTDTIGILPAELASLATLLTSFEAAVNQHVTAQAAAIAARQLRDTARDGLESWLRTASQRVQVCPTTSDADRAGLGITVRDAEPTPPMAGDTRPVPTVNTAQRFRHELRWRDETSGKRAKPAGMSGCEVWVKVGEAPADPSECRFLGIESRSSFVAEFNGEDGGKTAHYMLRWVNTKGKKGPWSETASATIQN